MTRIDLLLTLMVIVWALNYSVVKQVFDDIPPVPFNVLRFSLASLAFLAALAWVQGRTRRSRVVDPMLHTTAVPSKTEWRELVWLGLIGHCAYHLCWATGLSMTTASNSALIVGAGPVVASTTASFLGHERIRPLHWTGILVSLLGVLVVVGHGMSLSAATVRGDMLTFAAVGCWTFFTIRGGRLMQRHSPLFVSGVTTLIGTSAYVLLALPRLGDIAWFALSPRVWWTVAFSGLLSVAAGSLIWYAVVQRHGVARAAVYSNLVPLVAVLFAAALAQEPLTVQKLLGAGLILGGVALTRLARGATAVAPDE